MLFIFIKKNIRLAAISAFILSLSCITSCWNDHHTRSMNEPARETKWTIMYYGDADCSLESALLADLAEMKSGFVDGQGVNLVALVDRIPDLSTDSSVLGENFTDTRLYRITHGMAWRIGGSTQIPDITTTSAYEANLGDASTLEKFIRFCKENYPAGHYALILSNHGGGAMKKNISPISPSYEEFSGTVNLQIETNICQDDTSSSDILYTSEISDKLAAEDSVDLFALDACLMSSVEFAYQFRNDTGNTGFKSDYMVASAPNETSNGFAYESIFKRLQAKAGDNGEADGTLGGNELYYNPAALTAEQLGAVIVEEQRDSTASNNSQSLSCLDLSKVQAVKEAVDAMSVKLAADSSAKTNLETLRGKPGNSGILLHYFDETKYSSSASEWVRIPYFDLYNLSVKIFESTYFTAIQSESAAVRDAVDALVVYSFANSDYSTFTANKSGVHIFFPAGDYKINASGYNQPLNCWFWQDWYNAIDISGKYDGAVPGKLAWCADGAASNGAVENWFELLDSWYDTQTYTPTNGEPFSNYNYYSI